MDVFEILAELEFATGNVVADLFEAGDNLVPLVVTDPGASLRDGAELSDLVPTALAYLGLDVPEEMTGAGVANLA